MQSTQGAFEANTSIFKDAVEKTRSDHDSRLRLKIESGLLLFLLGLIFYIRIANINYNTLFVDEAIYATIGEEAISGVITQDATTWMYGSYLYPSMAAIASHFGGVIGLRALSAVLSTVAAVFVFLTTVRLFGQQAALWAMLVFGLTGGSISLGQLAVYDTLAAPLLAVALYCLVTAALKTDTRESYYLIAAAASFSLSVLSKYIVMLYLPALILVALALYTFQGRSFRPLITKFLSLTAVILGAYAWYYLSDLIALFTYSGGVYSFQSGTRWVIARVIWEEMGTALLMALAGTFLLSRMPFDCLRFRDRSAMLLAAILVPFLILSLLAAPIYHLLNENIGSLWKHLVYSVIFLSPLAGRGFTFVIWKARALLGRWAIYYRVLGAAITVVGLAWFIDHSLDQNWWIQHSWPNVTNVVEYMRSQGVTEQARVLADGAQIYEYYFDFGVYDRDTWHNTWYLDYKGLQGVQAMIAAIRDHAFDFVVLDGYYNPGVTQDLETALIAAGYNQGYEESQKLGSGENIHLQVYVAPEYVGGGN